MNYLPAEVLWWLQGQFMWVNGRPSAGTTATLLYNRDSSDLRHKKDISVHVGCNGWDGETKEIPMSKASKAVLDEVQPGRGDWYLCQVAIPARATVIDFVVSDSIRQVCTFAGSSV
jgi:hypothetical protein